MKKRFLQLGGNLIVVLLVLMPRAGLAGNASAPDAFTSALSSVPVPEMPARAARLVAQAKPDSLKATTEAVISAASKLNPAATVAVVGAIAGQSTEVAQVAAAQAAKLQPKESAWIARAAAGSAPALAGKVVAAVCKAVPSQYAVVATAVAQVAPDSTSEILEAVVTAIPVLKPFVEQARKDVQGAEIGVIMARTQTLVHESLKQMAANGHRATFAAIAASSAANETSAPRTELSPLPPPTVGPPFTPVAGPPTEINRTNTVEVPPGGGRNYSGG